MRQFFQIIRSSLTKEDSLKIFLISVIKSLILTVICIAVNIIGVFASGMIKNTMFLDFCGTIAAGIIYGPIHAALVGIITIYFGQVFGQLYLKDLISSISSSSELHTFNDYFLFAPVHMAIGAVVFFVPRLLLGKWSVDFFCSNAQKYPAGRLLISMIFFALLTNLASSLMVAIIMSIDALKVTCADLMQNDTTSNSKQFCEFTKLLFNDIDSGANYYLIKLFVSKFIMSLPDHLVCFPSAVVVVAYVLNLRRYKMSKKFAKTVIINHPAVGTFYFCLFMGLVCLYTFNVKERADISAAFMVWSLYNTLIVYIFFMVLSGRLNVWWFKRKHEHVIRKKYTYKNINPNMKDAYEDSLKFAILYSVALYFIVTWLKVNDPIYNNIEDPLYKNIKEKLIGALGVVAVISLVRYLMLIVARIGRYIGELWRREHKKNKSKDQPNSDVTKKKPKKRPAIG